MQNHSSKKFKLAGLKDRTRFVFPTTRILILGLLFKLCNTKRVRNPSIDSDNKYTSTILLDKIEKRVIIYNSFRKLSNTIIFVLLHTIFCFCSLFLTTNSLYSYINIF